MAITIPIISEFDGKGINRAISEFKQLETTGEKAQFALRKAALPAAAALTGLAAAAAMATKAAAEDAKAQELLAQTLRNTTGATEAQIAANEDYIATTERAAAVSDDQLRPALGNLVRATGNVTQSQQLLNLALDISAATGRDLESVSIALAKASQGQATALQRLGVPLDEALVKTKDFEGIVSVLTDTFSGAAAVAADSFEGRMRRVSIAIDNTKENIGKALIPILEDLLPLLDRAALFAEENADKIAKAGIAAGVLAGGILAANGALKLYNASVAIANGLTAVLGGVSMTAAGNVGTLTTKLGLVTLAAWAAYESFNNLAADGGFAFKGLAKAGVEFTNLILAAFEKLAEGVNFVINSIIRAYNLVSPFQDIPLLPTDIDIGRIPIPFGGTAATSRASNVPDRLEPIPSLPVPFTPISPISGLEDIAGGGGGAGGTRTLPAPVSGLSIDPRALALPTYQLTTLEAYGQTESARLADLELLNATPAINVTVNTVTAPSDLGQTIVDALIQYNRTSGPIDVLVA
jgi:hypothetical protein